MASRVKRQKHTHTLTIDLDLSKEEDSKAVIEFMSFNRRERWYIDGLLSPILDEHLVEKKD